MSGSNAGTNSLTDSSIPLQAGRGVQQNNQLQAIGDFLPEDGAEVGKPGVHTGVAADHGDDAVIALQALKRQPEVLRCHFPEPGLVFQEPRAIRAGQVAFVGHIDADDVHVPGRPHPGNRLIRRHGRSPLAAR